MGTLLIKSFWLAAQLLAYNFYQQKSLLFKQVRNNLNIWMHSHLPREQDDESYTHLRDFHLSFSMLFSGPSLSYEARYKAVNRSDWDETSVSATENKATCFHSWGMFWTRVTWLFSMTASYPWDKLWQAQLSLCLLSCVLISQLSLEQVYDVSGRKWVRKRALV